MYVIDYNGWKVECHLCNDGNWLHDTVFVYNNKKTISKKEIAVILDYLYNEGFIQDRRTKYEILER